MPVIISVPTNIAVVNQITTQVGLNLAVGAVGAQTLVQQAGNNAAITQHSL
jgi:hypothetical protein